MAEAKVSEVVETVLGPLLGRFTAGKAVELAAKGCRRPASELTAADLPTILDELRPMLRTLLGGPTTLRVLAELQERLGDQGS